VSCLDIEFSEETLKKSLRFHLQMETASPGVVSLYVYPVPQHVQWKKGEPIKSMRWVWHVARMGEWHTQFWLESLKGRDHLEDPGVDEKVILELILGKLFGKVWTGCIWLRIRTSEHGNEPSGSMKGGEFFDYPTDCSLLKKDSVP